MFKAVGIVVLICSWLSPLSWPIVYLLGGSLIVLLVLVLAIWSVCAGDWQGAERMTDKIEALERKAR